MTDTQEQEIANPVHHDQGTKPGEGLEAYRKMLKATIYILKQAQNQEFVFEAYCEV